MSNLNIYLLTCGLCPLVAFLFWMRTVDDLEQVSSSDWIAFVTLSIIWPFSVMALLMVGFAFILKKEWLSILIKTRTLKKTVEPPKAKPPLIDSSVIDAIALRNSQEAMEHASSRFGDEVYARLSQERSILKSEDKFPMIGWKTEE